MDTGLNDLIITTADQSEASLLADLQFHTSLSLNPSNSLLDYASPPSAPPPALLYILESGTPSMIPQTHISSSSHVLPIRARPAVSTRWAAPGDWSMYRDKITRLYRDEKKKLDDVRAIMERDHSFIATPRMYKDRLKKWGIYRNLRERDALAMSQIKAQRDGIGKSTKFFRGDTEVDFRKVARHLSRKGILLEDYLRAISPSSLIRVVTPPPARRDRNYVDNIEEALIHIRNWIDGINSSGTPILGDYPRSDEARLTFEWFLMNGIHWFCRGDRVEGGRHLNIAFSSFLPALQEGCPILICDLVHMYIRLRCLYRQDEAACHLFKIAWGHIRDLAFQFFCNQHSLKLALQVLGEIVSSEILRPEVALISRLVIDCVQKWQPSQFTAWHLKTATNTSFEIYEDLNEDADLLWSVFEADYVSIEGMVRKLISINETQLLNAENYTFIINLQRTLASIVLCLNKPNEAIEIYSEILATFSPYLSTLAESDIFSITAEIHLSCGNQEEAGQAVTKGFHILASAWGEGSDHFEFYAKFRWFGSMFDLTDNSTGKLLAREMSEKCLRLIEAESGMDSWGDLQMSLDTTCQLE